jgi:hypothetical protein
MRNTPLRGFMKSPLTQKKDSSVKSWKKIAKTIASGKGVGSKALGVVGLMLDATVTSDTDQPGTGTHGGKKSGSIRDMK